MATILRMPAVVADAAEALLAEWLVTERASFTAGDAIATVETEKALVDIEADEEGVILKALAVAGTRVAIGAPIAVLGALGEDVDDLEALLAELGVDSEAPASYPERRDVPNAADRVESAQQMVAVAPPQRVFASPLARKLATAADLRLEEIEGTGPRNRVTRRDVERAVSARSSAFPVALPAVAPAAPGPAPTQAAPRSAPSVTLGAEQREGKASPHTSLRRAIADRLQQSKRDAPHFYVRTTVRADRLVALRAEINDNSDVRVSINDLLIKAVAGAHRSVPEMNVIWTPPAIHEHEQVDVAVAVATERGLLTPVVRGVDQLTVTAVAAQVRDLAERARTGTLRQHELEGGTISVTNLGMFGVEEFAAIINPPHAAILAIGAVRDEPVIEEGQVVAGKVLTVTMSVDHRPVDGVVAAQWLAAYKGLLENPGRILA